MISFPVGMPFDVLALLGFSFLVGMLFHVFAFPCTVFIRIQISSGYAIPLYLLY